jgi:drug/metabolite transporter (DMT)-like permease
MTDERPRPQYGEYAPEGWVSPVPAQPEPSIHGAPPVPAPVDRPPAPRRWDRVLTVGLLAFGLYWVVSGYFSFSDLSAIINQVFDQYGIGEFTSTAAASSAGTALMVVQSVFWAGAVLVAVSRLRANKLAFFWPLVFGAVSMIVCGVIVGVVMTSDPAFTAYLEQMAG